LACETPKEVLLLVLVMDADMPDVSTS